MDTFFEQHALRRKPYWRTTGTDTAADFPPFELFPQLEVIDHRTTRVRRPQSSGFVERLHRTLLDERFRALGYTTWYESVDQMQNDFDKYLHHYNYEPPHLGRMMNGRTPSQAFIEGIVEQPEPATEDAA